MRDISWQTKKLLAEIESFIRNRFFTEAVERGWRTIEQDHAYKVMKVMNLIHNDILNLSEHTATHRRGRKSLMGADDKVRILLVKQLLGESNRKMMYMLVVFSAISGLFIGYKNIERFYSDAEVYDLLMVLKETLYSRYQSVP